MKNTIQPKSGIEQNSIQHGLKRNLARFSVSFEYPSLLGYSKSRTSLRLAGRYGQLNPEFNHIREKVFCLGEKRKEKTKTRLSVAGEVVTNESQFQLAIMQVTNTP